MATTLNLTTTYDGEVAGDFIMRAFQASPSLDFLTVRSNIPWKQKVRRIGAEVTEFQDMACAFTPGGTVDIDEREIELKALSVQRELCKVDFLEDYEALRVQNGDLGSISDALQDVILAGVAELNDTKIWQGIAGTGSYDGLLTLMKADPLINDVASPEVITPANVLAKIVLLIAEMPDRVLNSTELPLIYMSRDVWFDYMQAQVAAGNGWYATAGPAVPKTYMGLYDIVVMPGMPANSMVMAQKKNLWFGTNKTADLNSIKVVDMEATTLDKIVRYSVDFYAATQYGFSQEIAVYAPGIS